MVAIGTATADGIRAGEGAVGPVEGVVTNRACKSGDLSANRRGSEGDVAASQRTSQADGGQAIKAIRTLDVHRATYRNAGLSDTAGNRRRGHLRR